MGGSVSLGYSNCYSSIFVHPLTVRLQFVHNCARWKQIIAMDDSGGSGFRTDYTSRNAICSKTSGSQPCSFLSSGWCFTSSICLPHLPTYISCSHLDPDYMHKFLPSDYILHQYLLGADRLYVLGRTNSTKTMMQFKKML